jgi:hypothetical protein
MPTGAWASHDDGSGKERKAARCSDCSSLYYTIAKGGLLLCEPAPIPYPGPWRLVTVLAFL